jgi:hypothetical protein
MISPVVGPLVLHTIPVAHHCVLHRTNLIQYVRPCQIVKTGVVLYQLFDNIIFKTIWANDHQKTWSPSGSEES